jgi:putative phosphoribosyl transferase
VVSSGNNMISKAVTIPIDNNNYIEGDLSIKNDSNNNISNGIVIFAHGSGSSRHSLRNKFVADRINLEGISTLLVDLLTREEESVDEYTREHRFNISLLAGRLSIVTEYVLNISNQITTKEGFSSDSLKRIGFFGASTGAAAALIVADGPLSDKIFAIVSRGGRVDLATKHTSLKKIKCPCLFMVGEHDYPVIEWNKQILDTDLSNVKEKQLIIIPGATHLFEEEGKLEEVSKHSAVWFKKYF